MSDNFIPLNQSTPVHNRWKQDKNQQHQQQQRYNNRQQNNSRRGGFNQQWRNNSRSSYGSNSSNNSFSQDSNNIDAYLHPSMLQDPWENLRKENQMNDSST